VILCRNSLRRVAPKRLQKYLIGTAPTPRERGEFIKIRHDNLEILAALSL